MLAHIDADAFFASALQRRHPELKGQPLLALGMGGGCVIAASYEAKALGVKTGMRLVEARKLAPKAIAMPSDFSEALKLEFRNLREESLLSVGEDKVLPAVGDSAPSPITTTIPLATPPREPRKLCVGMCTFDDYDGVYFSVQAIRMFHSEVSDQIEIRWPTEVFDSAAGIEMAARSMQQGAMPPLTPIYGQIHSLTARVAS